jgi:hypothetical protein
MLLPGARISILGLRVDLAQKLLFSSLAATPTDVK